MVTARTLAIGAVLAAAAATASPPAAAAPCRGAACGAVEIHAELEDTRVEIITGKTRTLHDVPVTVALAAGRHQIVARALSGRPWSRVVTVNAGEAIGVFATFSGIPEPEVRGERLACDGGDDAACGRLGWTLATHLKVRVPAEGAKLLARACNEGVAASCHQLGRYHDDGLAGGADHATAARFYRKACEAGVASACTDLGALNEHGHGVPVDEIHARQLYERACGGGDVLGCQQLALVTGGAAPPLDDATAAAVDERRCLVDAPRAGQACSNLAARVDTGKGIVRERLRAALLRQRACRLDPFQCVALGDWIAAGVGFTPSPKDAVHAYREACTRGALAGCARAGAILRQDKASEHEARLLLFRGCRHGDAESCTELGVMHEHGIDTRVDTNAAREHYARGCKLGHAPGCERLKKLP